MEADKNPMPEIDIFPRIKKCANFVFGILSYFPEDAPPYLSDHYDPIPPPDEPLAPENLPEQE